MKTEQMTLTEQRRVAIGAAHSYLTHMGINITEVNEDSFCLALDDLYRIHKGDLVATRWYVWAFECSRNQVRLFRSEVRAVIKQAQDDARFKAMFPYLFTNTSSQN